MANQNNQEHYFWEQQLRIQSFLSAIIRKKSYKDGFIHRCMYFCAEVYLKKSLNVA